MLEPKVWHCCLWPTQAPARAAHVLLSLLCLFLVVSGPVGRSEARSLHWRQFRVQADLDSRGRLHVVEQQTMVFDGAWNGGERRFNLLPGQRLTFHGLSRIEPQAGTRVPLQAGSLDQVDNYSWHSPRVLRWRARLPDDPVFRHQAITYVLDYTLTNVVVALGEGVYLLDHDFCFPDRQGAIRHFVLDLRIDSAWTVNAGGLFRHLERDDLGPGRSVRLAIRLRHPGAGPVSAREPGKQVTAAGPSPPPSGAPGWLCGLVLAGLGVFLVFQAGNLLRREEELGRFVPLVPLDRIDRQWLQTHIFSLPPEVVGATWDRVTTTDEVAAVLARMVVEDKLASSVKRHTIRLFGFRIPVPGRTVLHLRLLVPRDTLRGYERKLVEGLFIDGDETDTRTVRSYYRKHRKVFDPVEVLEDTLHRRMNELTEDRKRPLESIWIPTLGLFFLAFFLLFADFFFLQHEHLAEVVLVALVLVTWMIGFWAAFSCRNASRSVRTRCLLVIGLAAGGLVAYGWAVFLLGPSILLLAGSGVLCLACLRNIINTAKTRESREGVEVRRLLASGREFFREELKRQRPDLDDRWLPYILAFGLGNHVDHWFRRYGGSDSGGASSGYGAGGNGGFTGGGGMFGGGGATGGWSSAVSAFSTSAGGSGGGGGSAGSGGGGGGGW